MPAYMIGRVDVTNLDKWKEYAAKAGPATEKFGGKYIVRGGPVHGLENFDDEGKRVVVVEFPDMEAAKAWYNSSEYQEAKILREDAGHARFMIVEGYEG